MSKTNYLGQNGLVYLITLIKNTFVKKVLKTGSESDYKVLSDNDLTDALKTNYDSAYTHSTQLHAPANAEANIIESVKVNGSPLPISSKSVDIAVPLISTDIKTDDSSNLKTVSPKAVVDYVTESLSSVTSIDIDILERGEYGENGVPTVEGKKGVIYFVPLSNSEESDIYREYIYVNDNFEAIGTTAVDLSGYLQSADLVEFKNEEIDSIWSSVS